LALLHALKRISPYASSTVLVAPGICKIEKGMVRGVGANIGGTVGYIVFHRLVNVIDERNMKTEAKGQEFASLGNLKEHRLHVSVEDQVLERVRAENFKEMGLN